MLEGIVSRARPGAGANQPEGRAEGRVVRRRRPLPNGRAAAGAFLVAVAALGTYVAASGATADPRRPYLVARADLPVGHRLTHADVAVGRMQLPPYLARGHAFSPGDTGRVVGSVVLGPVARGELLQAAQLSPPGAAAHQVSFAVESARAVGGSLRPGESVDVVATYRGPGDGTTAAVVRAARVVTVRRTGGLAGGDGLVVTVQVAGSDEAVALAHAVDAGQVTLVRSGGAG